MYVNPFWFGVLMTIVGLVVFIIVVGLIRSARGDGDLEHDEEYQRILANMDGKNFFMITKDGYLVGSEVEDKDDEKENG